MQWKPGTVLNKSDFVSVVLNYSIYFSYFVQHFYVVLSLLKYKPVGLGGEILEFNHR